MQVNVTETVYRNYQKITLQESPGSVQAGRLPRHREVVLLHDLIDCARPGEEIQVTGEPRPAMAHPVDPRTKLLSVPCRCGILDSKSAATIMQGCTPTPTMQA